MIEYSRFLAVFTFQISIALVCIGSAFFIFSKDGKSRIIPTLRQLGSIWFGIGCALFLVSGFNLIATVSGILIEHLILGAVALSVGLGILTVIFQLIRLTDPMPHD